jgi:hypothetical protein
MDTLDALSTILQGSGYKLRSIWSGTSEVRLRTEAMIVVKFTDVFSCQQGMGSLGTTGLLNCKDESSPSLCHAEERACLGGTRAPLRGTLQIISPTSDGNACPCHVRLYLTDYLNYLSSILRRASASFVDFASVTHVFISCQRRNRTRFSKRHTTRQNQHRPKCTLQEQT